MDNKIKISNKKHDFQEIINTKWRFIHKRSRSPFYTNLLFVGVQIQYNRDVPFDYRVPGIYIDQELALAEKEWVELGARVLRHMKKDPEILIRLLNDSYILNRKIEKFCQKISLMNLRGVSDDFLLAFYEEYLNLTFRAGAYVCLPLSIESILEKDLIEIAKKYFPNENQEKIFQLLATPIKAGTAEKEELSFLKIAASPQAQRKKLIKKHLYEYGWIKNNSFVGSFMEKKDIQNRLKAISRKEARERIGEYAKKQAGIRRLIKAHIKKVGQKDKKAKSLIETLQESIYHRSWRSERYYRNAEIIKNFFEEVSRRHKIPENLIYYFSCDEMRDCLQGNSFKKFIQKAKERKNGYACITHNGFVRIYEGRELAYLKSKIRLREIHAGSEIKGQAAFLGKVRGMACVVKNKTELSKVSKGDILVSPSTTVDYVPVLKYVKAIVTEEGGVLSHASVISRELHIPCVIGTKIATEVIKDGDYVEVDAFNGVVKILNK